eukprot:9468366-Pyramimonas_sp.AAC.2
MQNCSTPTLLLRIFLECFEWASTAKYPPSAGSTACSCMWIDTFCIIQVSEELKQWLPMMPQLYNDGRKVVFVSRCLLPVKGAGKESEQSIKKVRKQSTG